VSRRARRRPGGRRLRTLFAAGALAVSVGAAVVATAGAAAGPAAAADVRQRLSCSACQGLDNRLGLFPGTPVLLQSYEPRPGADALPASLANVAFVYDNALAAVALLACGRTASARQIGDALVRALRNDRFFDDGRLRNAYAAGPVGEGGQPIGIPGYWSDSDKIWREDAYHVGAATGSTVWGALALLNLHAATGEDSYLQAARRIVHWVNTNTADDIGVGGFRGGYVGHEPSPMRLGWKSTEHNADVYAANRWLGRIAPDQGWNGHADNAFRFLEAMWLAREGHFLIGTLPDGVTRNTAQSGLDAQLWPLIAVPDFAGRADQVLDWVSRTQAVDGGYDFNADRDGIWLEGTAQAALVMRAFGRDGDALRLFATLDAHRVGDGLVYSSSVDGLTTGLSTRPGVGHDDFVYYRLPHIGATAWVALAATGWNPFTGRIVSGRGAEDLSCPPKS
jgi:hypothetical protein